MAEAAVVLDPSEVVGGFAQSIVDGQKAEIVNMERMLEQRAAGEEPETFDKEFLRRWYVEQGYRGEGPPPPLPPELAERMSRTYRRHSLDSL